MKETKESRRRKSIGASEIGSVLGLNKWQSAYDLWEIKTGRRKDDESNIYMEMGTAMEPIVADQFSKRRPEFILHEAMTKTGEQRVFQHPKHPFITCTPDRLILNPSDLNQFVGLVECKTTVANMDAESIPLSYYAQVQYQAGILRDLGHPVETIVIAVLKSYYDFFYVPLEFDPEFYDQCVSAAIEFWDLVRKDQEPPVQTSNDILRRGIYNPNAVELNDSMAAELERLKEIKSQIKDLEEQADEIAEATKLHLGGSDTGIYDGRVVVTWKEIAGRASLDQKAIREEEPEIYEKYLRTGKPYRMFRLKI